MNLNMLGIGLAVTFGIIALSAITLYLSFRIKETFRDDRSTKMQIVKAFFLIGILFLAGGVFYFSANGMNAGKANVNNSIISASNVTADGAAFLGVSYPASVKTSDNYTIVFTVKTSVGVIHNATIKIVGLNTFKAKSNFKIEYDIIDIGDIRNGEANGYLKLNSPWNPMVLQGALVFQSEETNMVTQPIMVNVIDIPVQPVNTNITPAPTSTPKPTNNYYIIEHPPEPTTAPTAAPTPAPVITPAVNNTSPPTPDPTPVPNQTVTPQPTPVVNQTVTPDPTPVVNQTATPIQTPVVNQTVAPDPNPVVNQTVTPTPMVTPTGMTPDPTPVGNKTG